MHRKNGPNKVVGEVQMLRLRVAAAESKLTLLRDQAREAKRRRKEAKRLAQRARTLFKRGKAQVAELRQSLAKAEVKLFQAGGRALARKMAGARRVSKGIARSPKKASAVVRSPASLSSAARDISRRILMEIPAAQRAVPVAPSCQKSAALECEPCPT
jgi:hypothetical protein